MHAGCGAGGDSLIRCWDIWGDSGGDFWVFSQVWTVNNSGSLRVN